MKGVFITIEGPDGAGKSSVIKGLSDLLEESLAVPLVTTREPGGIAISEKIREIILDPSHEEMDERTEALLYAAARRQHLVQKIVPGVDSGAMVLCDRFIDSSLAYQGAARGIGMKEVAQINEFAIQGYYPELTLYLDVEARVGLERIAKGRDELLRDRLDNESLAFHESVRAAYLQILADNPERMVRVDAKETLENVIKTCYDLIKARYSNLFLNSEGNDIQ